VRNQFHIQEGHDNEASIVFDSSLEFVQVLSIGAFKTSETGSGQESMLLVDHYPKLSRNSLAGVVGPISPESFLKPKAQSDSAVPKKTTTNKTVTNKQTNQIK